jgi:1-deoxy-D-xylulose-5-phosphate reductoisomerase
MTDTTGYAKSDTSAGTMTDAASHAKPPTLLAVLGATGSIGKNTLDVVRAFPYRFRPVLLTANSDEASLAKLGKEFQEARLVLASKENVCEAVKKTFAVSGKRLAVNGIAGAAGLLPSLAVLECGADLALANKETIVMAWALVEELAKKSGSRVIPVDSEHSAIFSLVNAHGRENVDELIITCSGGQFLNLDAASLSRVSLKDALKHPTWSMGAKITIDSSTLANKGLEVIEAARLFGMESGKIKVVIHPQSIVHSMVRLKDGEVYAQLSKPDMRLPIHNALFYPDIAPCPFGSLPLDGKNFGIDGEPLHLDFAKPDTARFPMLSLAYHALATGPLAAIAYNAANEEAVSAFMREEAGFSDIPKITERVLQQDWTGSVHGLDSILEADRRAREMARGMAALIKATTTQTKAIR